MEIGPLEYVVLGFEDHQFANEVLPELSAIQASGLIRAVDLLFVSKATDGTTARAGSQRTGRGGTSRLRGPGR